MKIASVEPILLEIPFDSGGRGEGIMPTTWDTLDFCLVRIETDSGLVGWGEAFGYFCHRSVAAMIERSLAPLLVGRELPHPREFSEEAQRKLVLQGRYGITTFALSGIDIALWDLRARAENVSLARLLGKARRDSVSAYASLVRYGDGDLVAEKSLAAAKDGYEEIKLHEITLPEIRRCREEIGMETRMTVDVNCNWTEVFTREAVPELVDLETRWLEEPIFPPEDFRTLASIRRDTGIGIGAGENVCTAFQFEQLVAAGAADYLQPSVTKIGGITEFLRVAKNNREHWRLPLMPHSPYFGPGYLATLQLAAIESSFEQFEYLYVKPESWLFADMPLPEDGGIAIPEGPGLGLEPDPDVLSRYRRG